MKHKPYGFYEKYIKRPQDFLCALLAAIVLSPVLLFTALLVRVKLGSPVLFTQERPGLNGEIFKLYKFRTMLPPKDGIIDPAQDAERLTTFGKKLRSTSLDELPELFNILIGDMSIIGPRPLASIYLPYYTKKEMHRHDVRPGLTGWAQVNGRNSVSWEDRFEYDVYYVNNCSFMMDVKIFFRTIGVVLSHKDIGQGEEVPESFNIVRQRQWIEGTVIKDR